jgi:hypothetical protein
MTPRAGVLLTGLEALQPVRTLPRITHSSGVIHSGPVSSLPPANGTSSKYFKLFYTLCNIWHYNATIDS